LDRLITIRLPTAYLQHCKLLFLTFVLVYPLLLSTKAGMWTNVISPFVLFVALLGFDRLADEMENPIGEDEGDLNIIRMLYGLERKAEEVFEVSMGCRTRFRNGFKTLLQEAGVTLTGMEFEQDLDQRNYRCRFSRFFKRVPLPNFVLRETKDFKYGLGRRLLRQADREKNQNQNHAWADEVSGNENGESQDAEEAMAELRSRGEQLGLVTTFTCFGSNLSTTLRALKMRRQAELLLEHQQHAAAKRVSVAPLLVHRSFTPLPQSRMGTTASDGSGKYIRLPTVPDD